MRHTTSTIATLLSASVLTVMLLWPVAASAQVTDTTPPMDVEQVRSGFVNLGYQVEPPLRWEWTNPPATTFRVTDAARDRLLVVLVYPTTAAAESAAPRDGRRLVLGFGPSTLWGNVALVQTNSGDLGRAYRAQKAVDDGMDGDRLVESPLVGARVDFDFLQALGTSVASL
jgi:hypothetical protein